jgi:hypothetical protein
VAAPIGDVSISPQQLWPLGQSHEYRQCVGAWPVPHDEVVPGVQVAARVDRVTQHVLDRTSHVALPLQTAGVKLLQSAPVHAPLTHAWPPQFAPLFCHCPLALQFCGCPSAVHCT